ncbi:sugar phosphate isomerase/epimerase and 4-hydroxyphenylpyruvate domain-containing protein [Azospirillum sp. SYSU D00513]|uniref:bifunctional sugar phosphate isomerase/epimerase/4-hydroxyphenylpyruvate dioxygenase family protein n=1 Tax=Azospirillum sp. SYSU D00513 TaxID=2812561 RepID=UPI001A96BE61|nr:sugar phosphate isomerase/epimerase and 4-hydroxyphenylpyruvate domain-containing protein [Azospirillum sp. SYSU D00513]
MLRSIATVSLSGTLPEKLEAIAAARFDGVEIFDSDLVYYDGTPRDVRRMAEDLGLQITLFQPIRDVEGTPRERRQLVLDRVERKMDVMGELGAEMALLCSNVASDLLRDDEAAAEDLALVAERAARRGIRIGYEALAWGGHVKTWRHAWSLVQAVNHPNLGLLVDSFHTLSLGDDPSGLASVPADRLFFVQLADAPRLQMDVLSWSRHFRCFPGQGQFDLPGFLGPIVTAGYAGPISLEIFNDEFRAAPTRATAEDGLRSLLYLEEMTADWLGRNPAAPAPAAAPTAEAPALPRTQAARRANLFSPPPATEFESYEFLEFAVDDADKAELAGWLDALGFTPAGRHRSKNVTLYEQGGIHLILNAERESFAHSFHALHGVSLCAMALRVDSAADALDRARLYNCKPYVGHNGPNEMMIPAVRAPDGSLVYFVDRHGPSIYEVDFEPVRPATGKPTGPLLGIDHTTLALPPGKLDAWTLFYRSVFGFDADDALLLPDPYGLIRSRAMRSPNSAIRIPLNISESRYTAAARSVETYSGAGVHHVAFHTDDIFAAVEELTPRGIRFLPIPHNYYEDIAARFGLPENLTDRMAAANVLYDRDAAGGEFFHVYTQPFQDRFFFEIVQRRNYAQYGAANAPVRLASLAQMRASSPFRVNPESL